MQKKASPAEVKKLLKRLMQVWSDPVVFCEQALAAKTWSEQKKILRSIRDNDRTAVGACHSIGKTFISAVAILWFLVTHPNSIVLMTAPTWRQVEKVIWPEFRSLLKRFEGYLEQFGIDIGATLQKAPYCELGDKWFALGFASTEPENAQGFHAPHMLLVIEEATGVNDAMFEGFRSTLASGHCRMLLLSNMTRPEGRFYSCFHGNRHLWKTFQISAWDTPNLVPLRYTLELSKGERIAILRRAESVIPFLISPQFVADIEEEYGMDSDVYRVRVAAQFPSCGDNQLISLHYIEAAIARWDEMFEGKKPQPKWWENLSKIGPENQIDAAMDVARLGRNESVFGARLGDIAAPQVVWNGLRTPELVARSIEQRNRFRASRWSIDEDGVGGGPFDYILAAGLPCQIIGFRGGAQAKDPQRFVNARAEAYWELKLRFEEGRIAIPRCDKIIGQLSSIRFKYTARGLLIESKDEMVARGAPSPDRADEMMMRFYSGSAVMVQTAMQPPSQLTNWGGLKY